MQNSNNKSGADSVNRAKIVRNVALAALCAAIAVSVAGLFLSFIVYNGCLFRTSVSGFDAVLTLFKKHSYDVTALPASETVLPLIRIGGILYIVLILTGIVAVASVLTGRGDYSRRRVKIILSFCLEMAAVSLAIFIFAGVIRTKMQNASAGITGTEVSSFAMLLFGLHVLAASACVLSLRYHEGGERAGTGKRRAARTHNRTKAMTLTAVFAAIATALMYLDIAIPIFPAFLKYDPSDVPALFAGFMFGPLSALFVILVKNLLHLFISSSMFVGELADFVLACSFVIPSVVIYKFRHTFKGAVVGLVIGSLIRVIAAAFLNQFVTIPLYMNIFGEGMVWGLTHAVLPSVDSIFKIVLIFIIPFNLLKSVINVIIVLLLYKHLHRYINVVFESRESVEPRETEFETKETVDNR